MKQIPLIKGYFAEIDDEDYEKFSKWNWQYCNGYAVRFFYENHKKIIVYMHREILKSTSSEIVDHIDGNRLNNQRHNLRLCTYTQNSQNRRISIRNTSGYKGVSWYTPLGKWRAQIVVNKKKIHIGYFDNPEDASSAYFDRAVLEFGSFASLGNF